MKKLLNNKITFLTIIIFSIFFLNNSSALATYGVQTKMNHCVASALPDSACSPGAVLTTDIRTICTAGYTKTVRNVSTATKKKVFKEYDIPYSEHSNYEVDHIISLELGGSNDISNLFPESYLIQNGARVKDSFENYLHKQICNGSITVTEAQKEISTDWLTYNTARLNSTKPITKINLSITPKSEKVTPQTADLSILIVKKSTTGLCHAPGTAYYTRTTHYVAYASITDCIANGGRLPTR